MIYNNIVDTIGNTPLVRLNEMTRQLKGTFVCKVESFNPGNSIKDRIALKLIDDAEAAGILKPGGTIVEGTSGNTGMGLALVAITRGYKCIFTTNDKQSQEKIDILKAVGAEVVVCPTDVSADDPRSYYSVAKKIADETPNSFYVNQYYNLSNRAAHYETTGPEIWRQTEGKITHLVVGVGTGGTISGTGKYLKEQNPDIKLIAIDTYGSALKKFHETGEFDEKEVYSYITEGIGEDIIPANIDFSIIDHFEKVSDKDGAVYARRLAKEEGIFSGYSAGSAVAALFQLQDQFKEDDLVVIILHDHGSRYVAKVYSDEWMRERNFLDDKPKTARSVIESRIGGGCLTIEADSSLLSAFKLMQSQGISQLPVTSDGELCGSITEKQIMQKIVEDPDSITALVKTAMRKPFPVVQINSTLAELSQQINHDNDAVMVKDANDHWQIITSFDLIKLMAN